MRQPAFVLITVFVSVGVASLVSLLAASEAQSASYSQVVDNTTAGRFTASSKWISSDYDETEMFGHNYRALRKPSSTARAARWKVKVPSSGRYYVAARWPANSGYTGRATYRIKTSDGWKTKTVSQKTNGGRWIRLGAYNLAAGDEWKIALASTTSSKGYIIADAVRVTRAGTTSTTDGSTGGGTSTTGAAVVREAETWLDVPYEWGGMDRNGVDCSGLTYRVYQKFGVTLPRTSQAQYSSGPGRIIAKSEAKPGDMVFFGSGPGDVVSVGIVSGADQVIKATVPRDVVRRESISAVARNVGGWTGYRRVI